MTALGLTGRWLAGLEWRRGFFAWARTDGVTWVYIFKVLVAAFVTLWLAMRLELPQPRTAMITVFIVMQPQSGHVFAKSFYRVLGTLAGSSMMVALLALFPQNTELFLPSLALWVGLCSAGAMRYRTFRAYGFVLAGYTAAMIGLPVLEHPQDAFMAAVWRGLEISLGILVSTLVSAAILPQSASAAMRNALYQRFGVFAGFVVEALRGDSQRDRFETSNVRFIAEAVGLESLRNVTAFEDPHMRRRNRRLARMNSEFMAVTTRFNALHQLLERLRLRGPLQIVSAIEPGLRTLDELLEPYVGRALTEGDALRLTLELAAYKEGLPAQIRGLRAAFVETGPRESDLLDFHTAYELLYRFVDDLHNYAQTHASLSAHKHEREQWDEPYVAQTSWLVSLAAGMRASVVLLLLGSFWILSDWPSGAMMTLIATVTVGLSAASPNPKRMSFQMACGTLLGAFIGFFETFFVFPWIDGFPLLCMVLAPVFVLGAFLSSRPAYAGYGVGLLVFFAIGSVPNNLTVFDPYSFINDYIGMVLGMLVCAAAGAIILPPNSRWLWSRLEQDLREQVLFAISGRLRGLGSAFESRTRDLLHQAYGLAAGQPRVQSTLLRWMFVVLEVGHAIIELRKEQAVLPVHPCYAESQPWRQAIRVMGRALARLFLQPSASNHERALVAVDHAISRVQATDEPFARHFDTSALRRVQSYLHFIRTSLLDPQSPLASQAPAQGLPHAP
ncbi:p-hydroxybenzoic acid efflux pump subunit AaeB [Pseudomonas fluorescens]|uniref:FUSC family protein n=1 Tax=Pseudomonas fluorescens TaxID=294 RepID=UPI001252A37A|nr:FUSC family protein [Pseudomonas fluorescens]CAG8866980.1 p-hydroxybenzoic acid efflux pump subunit AaeB [Pseudomonas fluorescens]VVP78242.1 p-hydroxybenzoic acid efflux pump subunit AaeB [Pseudomonas fluorescens]